MVMYTYNYTRQSGDWLPVRRRQSLRRTTIFLGKTTANWGSDNFINNTGFATTYGVIGGGQGNCIFPGTNHSSIFSGNGNCVSGSCSSILGGSGNSDGGFNYVGIFGQNVTGVIPNAFHAENFVGQNMPLYTGTLPYPAGSKALFYCCDPLTLLCHVLIA